MGVVLFESFVCGFEAADLGEGGERSGVGFVLGMDVGMAVVRLSCCASVDFETFLWRVLPAMIAVVWKIVRYW